MYFMLFADLGEKNSRRIKTGRKGIFKMISGIANAVVMFLLVLMGGIPVLYLTLSIPVVVVWKIYRKIKYGYTLYD